MERTRGKPLEVTEVAENSAITYSHFFSPF